MGVMIINQLTDTQLNELKAIRDVALTNPTDGNVGAYYQYLIDNEGSEYAIIGTGIRIATVNVIEKN
jgi:hypothetical protein